MNKIIISIEALLLFLLNIASAQEVTHFVNPFICTAGDHGQLDPSATVPFGMMKLGPDTDPGNHSGYDYHAKRLLGFSHNRIGGVGCNGAGGNLRILPGIGDDQNTAQSEEFIKGSEEASPCYYAVTFSNGIKAELTATNQTGFHRYTFPESDCACLSVDIASSLGGTISASKTMINGHEFSVKVSARNVCGIGRYTVYYHVWCNKALTDQTKEGDKLVFRMKTAKNEQVLLQVTASTISEDDAKKEWESETRQLTFDEVRKTGLGKWQELLSKIKVEGKDEYKMLFYTHLYHIFLNPVRSENRLKEFRSTDGEIHKSEGYVHYDCWSMWDNFRNKFSLYPLLVPDIANDIANSLADLYKYGKPFWSGFNEPVPTVRTEHTIITLLDFYRRGITCFDLQSVYRVMSAEINNIPGETPDKKLELSYDFWALAQFAQILDKKDDYFLFSKKADEYKQVWKAKFLVMKGNSDIMHGDGLYEGTIWQYRWNIQFDIAGVMEMMGGEQNYTQQLEYFFDHNLYNHGNQPDIHAPFMFDYGSKPWLTQKWVNKILTKDMIQCYGTHEKWEKPYNGRIYKNSPEGYIPEMDDDEGTMSGWFVLASMGIYPVLTGEPVFQLSTPIFDKITLHLPGNKEFIIKTNGLSDRNFYIRSATLNGKPFNQAYLRNEDIISGGILEFNVSDKPNKTWGTSLKN